MPNLNLELAWKVMSYRDKNGKISSFEDLTDIKGFPRDKIQRIKLYLSIEQ
ncbi:helix-hairpin-helix domain-containing protein [Salinimicrobium marinum]|uniref:helix-hairpin-helix domain-containing protein n=1 Tax=Salinimicrobium marinum TaxID=680283 RepID=UPI00167687B1